MILWMFQAQASWCVLSTSKAAVSVYMHFKLYINTVMLCGNWHDTDWTTPKSIFDCDGIAVFSTIPA